jgi:hypothetical protein
MMEKQITNKGVEGVGRFNCFGRFTRIKKDHPTAEELDEARTFARSVAQTYAAIPAGAAA